MEEETVAKTKIGHYILGTKNVDGEKKGFIKVKSQQLYDFDLGCITLDENYNLTELSDKKKYFIYFKSVNEMEYRESRSGDKIQIVLYLKGNRDRSVRGKVLEIPVDVVEPIASALRIAGALVNEDKPPKEDTDLKEFNIKKELKKQGKPTEEEIKEMLSKVNIELFMKIVKNRMYDEIGDAKKIEEQFTKEICLNYLRRWAEAKYCWYILLGRKLKLEEEIETEKTSEWFKYQIREVSNQHPIYKQILQSISDDDFKDNEMRYYPSEWNNDKRVKKGMKFTKFMALFNDNDLNMDISKLYQDKGISKIVISIEPADYLTASINQSGWRSCHNFYNGEWCQAPMAYMLDESSAISYVYDKDVDYNDMNWKYKTNSKKWREMVYWSATTSTVVFSRQYPYASDIYASKIRKMFETRFCEEFDAKDLWRKAYNCSSFDVEVVDDGYVYNDVDNGFNHIIIKNKYDKSNARQEIHIGVESYENFVSKVEHDDSSSAYIW